MKKWRVTIENPDHFESGMLIEVVEADDEVQINDDGSIALTHEGLLVRAYASGVWTTLEDLGHASEKGDKPTNPLLEEEMV